MNRRASLAAACGAIMILSLAAACDKVPLLAPTGSVISIFATANTVSLNSEIEIVANVIENGTTATPPAAPGTGTPGTGTPGTGTPSTGTGTTTTTSTGAGTPVQNGTLVTFTTTIGRIEPSEARTSNGQVRVRFIAGGQSGTATITAFSGGASGRLENLKVGAAGVERVVLTASPQTLAPGGGPSTITARVEDVSGTGVPGIPVTFSTDAGSFSNPTVTTDASGNAQTILNTSRASKVTVNVAGKTAEVNVGLNPRTGLTLTVGTSGGTGTGTSGQIAAGQPAIFTVGVGTTAPVPNIRDVTIDFGDGTQQSLGAISGSTTVQHTYQEPGTYIVRATALDASGFSEQVSTSVTVLPGQPPAVTIQASNNNPTIGETVIFTATVSGATSTVLRYEWDFGNGAEPRNAVTTGNRATATYGSVGTKVITVRVVQSSGPSGEGTTTVRVVGATGIAPR